MNFAVDPDTRASWESAWKEFDSTLNKKLGLSDLRMAFLSIGKDITQKELATCCKNGKEASFEQFVEFMMAQPKQGADPAAIRNAVTILSMYTGGQLKTSELRLMLTCQGDKLSNNEAAALVSDADPHKTGFVDTEAFCQRIGAK